LGPDSLKVKGVAAGVEETIFPPLVWWEKKKKKREETGQVFFLKKKIAVSKTRRKAQKLVLVLVLEGQKQRKGAAHIGKGCADFSKKHRTSQPIRVRGGLKF